MKTVTILFAHKNSKYLFEPAFDGKSAFQMSMEWAFLNQSEKVYVFAFNENKDSVEKNLPKEAVLVCLSDWTVRNLISEAAKAVKDWGAESAVFAWADCPYLNRKLTQEILDTHKQFLSEYTFAEGYSYGFAPEVIDGGTLSILKTLSENQQEAAGNVSISRTAFYDFLKTDINAFEVETVLSDEDYRLSRYSFDCGKKENLLQCIALFNTLSDEEKNALQELDAEKLSSRAAKNQDILKTVPGFYNIQLSPVSSSKPVYIPENSPVNRGGNMETSEALKLIDKIAGFSENAVIGLSFFGDPVNHPDFVKICEKILSYSGLSVFVETDFMSLETARDLKVVSDNSPERTNGFDKIMIAINMDASTPETFSKIRRGKEGDFEKAVQSVAWVAELFPTSTYPQFIRMNENEEELESFYRFWNEKGNPSKGNLIIQKYNSFCKTLPDRKPADLSPVERNVCWHLRRDMNILSNGDVTFCHCLYGKVIGNVFSQNLEEIWKSNNDELKNQSEYKYCSECGDCDEYYTFNF